MRIWLQVHFCIHSLAHSFIQQLYSYNMFYNCSGYKSEQNWPLSSSCSKSPRENKIHTQIILIQDRRWEGPQKTTKLLWGYRRGINPSAQVMQENSIVTSCKEAYKTGSWRCETSEIKERHSHSRKGMSNGRQARTYIKSVQGPKSQWCNLAEVQITWSGANVGEGIDPGADLPKTLKKIFSRPQFQGF